MRTQSFANMQTLYDGNGALDPDDLVERRKLLTKYKYSVIVEGEYMEFDNLHRWIKQNIGENSVENIYYGKTDYDYGFVEFFLSEKLHAENMRLAIPNIYTIYPAANPSAKICKSNGNKVDIDYTPADKDAIIYSADESS